MSDIWYTTRLKTTPERTKFGTGNLNSVLHTCSHVLLNDSMFLQSMISWISLERGIVSDLTKYSHLTESWGESHLWSDLPPCTEPKELRTTWLAPRTCCAQWAFPSVSSSHGMSSDLRCDKVQNLPTGVLRCAEQARWLHLACHIHIQTITPCEREMHHVTSGKTLPLKPSGEVDQSLILRGREWGGLPYHHQ